MTETQCKALAIVPQPSRRVVLGQVISTAVALYSCPAAAVPADDSALLELAALILAIRREVNRIDAEQVWPCEEEYYRLLGDVVTDASWKRAAAFSRSSGRNAGITAGNRLLEHADKLTKQLLAMPARTVAGRQAKLKTLFVHVLPDEWFTSDREADYEIEVARRLLCELAGLTVEDMIATVRESRPFEEI